jgi:hypothetical protein
MKLILNPAHGRDGRGIGTHADIVDIKGGIATLGTSGIANKIKEVSPAQVSRLATGEIENIFGIPVGMDNLAGNIIISVTLVGIDKKVQVDIDIRPDPHPDIRIG